MALTPGPQEIEFNNWYDTKFKPAMERGPLDKYVARQAWFSATAPLLERIAELEAENHNLNWALGTEGFDQMATPEEQAEHEKGHAAAMANIARIKAHKERHDQLVPDGVDYLDHIAALTTQVEQATEQQALLRKALSETEAFKAAPVMGQVEQAAQPVHYRALLADEQRPHQLKTAMHVVGFRTWKAADDFVASERDMNGWRYTIEPLYTAPPKAVPLTISEDDAFNLAKHVYAHSQPYDAPQILLTGKELKAIIEAAHNIGTPATVEKG